MLWLSAPILCGFFFFLPETSSATILYYRARRLRRITGNDQYRSQSEIDQAKKQMTMNEFYTTPSSNRSRLTSLILRFSSLPSIPALSTPSSIPSSNLFLLFFQAFMTSNSQSRGCHFWEFSQACSWLLPYVWCRGTFKSSSLSEPKVLKHLELRSIG
jgi:hypothetical protein